MFKFKNPYKKLGLSYILHSFRYCPVCHLKYKPEPGFWFGTSYVSYALMIVVSLITFFLWWLIIGLSTDDYRLFYWLIFNGVVLIALQPYVMRLSRVIFLSFFIKYNPHYDEEPPPHIF